MLSDEQLDARWRVVQARAGARRGLRMCRTSAEAEDRRALSLHRRGPGPLWELSRDDRIEHPLWLPALSPRHEPRSARASQRPDQSGRLGITLGESARDRKSVVEGKSVDLGGRRII